MTSYHNHDHITTLNSLIRASLQLPCYRYDLFFLNPSKAQLVKLTKLYDDGELSGVTLDSIYTLGNDNAGFVNSLWGAMAKLKSRRTVGKVVFEFESGSE